MGPADHLGGCCSTDDLSRAARAAVGLLHQLTNAMHEEQGSARRAWAPRGEHADGRRRSEMDGCLAHTFGLTSPRDEDELAPRSVGGLADLLHIESSRLQRSGELRTAPETKGGVRREHGVIGLEDEDRSERDEWLPHLGQFDPRSKRPRLGKVDPPVGLLPVPSLPCFSSRVTSLEDELALRPQHRTDRPKRRHPQLVSQKHLRHVARHGHAHRRLGRARELAQPR